MAHIKKSIRIHAPVQRVFALARDPKHWASFWVGLSEPEEVNGTGEVGTVVKHSYLMAGVRFPVTSRSLALPVLCCGVATIRDICSSEPATRSAVSPGCAGV